MPLIAFDELPNDARRTGVFLDALGKSEVTLEARRLGGFAINGN